MIRSADELNDELDDQHESDDDDLECTHCGGDGLCAAACDWFCCGSPELHNCHACSGSGNRRDQRVF